MIRIISGKYGGRKIESPKSSSTRPTTNRVRESVFSSFCANYGDDLSLIEARVLDVFAGSGALGIEALSRGAEFVCFNEMDNQALSIIEQNLISLNISKEYYSLLKKDAFSPLFVDALKGGLKPFDIILLDPPFQVETNKVFDIINNLYSCNLLQKNTLIYYEHHSSELDITLLKPNVELIYHRIKGTIQSDIIELI